jgi:hypothetical protein
MIINGILVTGHVDKDGQVYLTAVNLDTRERRAETQAWMKREQAKERAANGTLRRSEGEGETEEVLSQETAERRRDGCEDQAPNKRPTKAARKRWTVEDKIEVAKRALESDNGTAAEEFGISKAQVAVFKSQFINGGF